MDGETTTNDYALCGVVQFSRMHAGHERHWIELKICRQFSKINVALSHVHACVDRKQKLLNGRCLARNYFIKNGSKTIAVDKLDCSNSIITF